MEDGSAMLPSLPSTSATVHSEAPVIEVSDILYSQVTSMERCIAALEANSLPTFPQPTDGSLWCNATWDTVLCWPATPASSSVTMRCPPIRPFNPNKFITKWCHSSGRWMGKTPNDFSREQGWTNFTPCYTFETLEMMKELNGSLKEAQQIAYNARQVEFVGLGLSVISLAISITIFSYFRRLRVFRNLLHLHLMIAILMVAAFRLIIYIDLLFPNNRSLHFQSERGGIINTTPFVCETMYYALEYFKTVAFAWMFLEGFYLHNQLVLTVFNSEPHMKMYLIAGYGLPFLHSLVWLVVVVVKKGGQNEICFGSYYLEPEFWILDGPRMLELVINSFFICNVIRVLWSKVRESHNTSEIDRMKKSVKAALMLIPLLGIPNIMQTIPISPTADNLTFFAIWTYFASVTYMYQGLIISVIYCFTNKEVRSVLKTFYGRYKLQHTSTNDLRRGSRSVAARQPRSGTMLSSVNGDSILPTYQSCARSKKGSDDSAAHLVIESHNPLQNEFLAKNGTIVLCDYSSNTVSERTPLRKPQFDCEKSNDETDRSKSNNRYKVIDTSGRIVPSVTFQDCDSK